MKLILLLLISCMFISGCSTPQYLTHTEYVVLIPDKLDSPNPPQYKLYRVNEPITSDYNFRVFQLNQLQMIDYITLLHRNLMYYELQITNLREKQKVIESKH